MLFCTYLSNLVSCNNFFKLSKTIAKDCYKTCSNVLYKNSLRNKIFKNLTVHSEPRNTEAVGGKFSQPEVFRGCGHWKKSG